ncbi:MAG: tetratricopeptide repeat protein [Planctomycetaceae bacterium]
MISRLIKHSAGLCVIACSLTHSPAEAFQFRRNDSRKETPAAKDSTPAATTAATPAQQPLNPTHERIKIEAEQAYGIGDFSRSIQLTTSVLTQNPKDHVALYLRSSARAEMGASRSDAKLIRDGIADAREAIRLSSGNIINYYLPYLYGMVNLAAIESDNKHAESALEIAAQVLERKNLKEEDRSNVLYQRGTINTFLKRTDAAIADFAESVKLAPTNLGSLVGLAESYAAAGKNDQALEIFNRTVATYPSNAVVYNNRGMFLQKIGKTQDAIVDFTYAIELDPNHVNAYTNRGFALIQEGDPEAAINDLNQSLKMNSDQAWVHTLRGDALMAQGNFTEAIADYKFVSDADPKDSVAIANMGFARFLSDDKAGALAAFSKAFELDPTARHLNTWQYWTMVIGGQPDVARLRFSDSLKRAVTQRDWVDNLLIYLMGAMNEDDLIKAAQASAETERDAHICEAQFFIGEKKLHSKEPNTAVDNFRLALECKGKHLWAYRGAQFEMKKFTNQQAAQPTVIEKR